MKKSQLIIVSALLVIALAVGFVIGVSVDFPKPSGDDLSGTIGKLNNYRNVKLGDDDIQLRSELLTNEVLKKQYQSYFSFHYASIVKLGSNIDYALQVANQSGDFITNYNRQIESLAEYAKNLEINRIDVLVALQVIQNLNEKNQANIGPILNNAQMAIAQVKYKEKAVTDFIEAIEVYIENAADGYNQDLKKAHDLLLINQVGQAIATNNKPAIKYFDNKELFGSFDINSNPGENMNAGYTDAINDLNNIQTVTDVAMNDINMVFDMQLVSSDYQSSNEEIVSSVIEIHQSYSTLDKEIIMKAVTNEAGATLDFGYTIDSDINTFGSEVQSICNEFQQNSDASNFVFNEAGVSAAIDVE
jgi:hypothetical protein